jgi:hypothetical protein
MLPTGVDDILVVLIQSAGLQADATLNNHQTLAAVLAANAEATFTNYSRKSIPAGSTSVIVNTSTGVTTVDIPDQVWNAAGGATNNTLGALLTCYRPTSGSADSAILPLTKHDYTIGTTGGTLTATIPSIGTVS